MPKNAKAITLVGRVLSHLPEGRDKAKRAFQKALAIDPLTIDAALGLADLHIAQGDWEACAALLRETLDHAGHDFLWSKLGEVSEITAGLPIVCDGGSGLEEGRLWNLNRRVVVQTKPTQMHFDTKPRTVLHARGRLLGRHGGIPRRHLGQPGLARRSCWLGAARAVDARHGSRGSGRRDGGGDGGLNRCIRTKSKSMNLNWETFFFSLLSFLRLSTLVFAITPIERTAPQQGGRLGRLDQPPRLL